MKRKPVTTLKRFFELLLDVEPWEMDGQYVHWDELCPLSACAVVAEDYDLENGWGGAADLLNINDVAQAIVAAADNDPSIAEWSHPDNIWELRARLLKHCGLTEK